MEARAQKLENHIRHIGKRQQHHQSQDVIDLIDLQSLIKTVFLNTLRKK